MIKQTSILYLYIFSAFMAYLLPNFFNISRIHSVCLSFFKLSQISKEFPHMFIEKNPHVNGPPQLKPYRSRVNCQLYASLTSSFTFPF